jgi:LPS-assembly lipoprotein|tara:strand:- start:1245 stop:1718 length:474 start_codon:yes stop_codon:yes gene_type:complete
MKKTFYIFFVLLFTSCGFSPILKNVDLSSVKINKIDFEGPSGLTYYLKSNLNIPVEQNLKNAYSLKLNINESSSSVTKDTAGITTEERVSVTINFQIFDKENKLIGSESLSDSRVISVTNNVSTDDEVKRIENENIITNLIQQLTFAIQAQIISSQK